jgi:hypothetical protein
VKKKKDGNQATQRSGIDLELAVGSNLSRRKHGGVGRVAGTTTSTLAGTGA